MPKQLYKITQFHGGLNSNSDARDIAENELSEAIDVMVDELGKIRMMGGNTVHGSTSLSPRANQISPGYGLFQFSHDRIDGHTAGSAAETGADYLAFSEADTSGLVDIYSDEDSTWGSPIGVGDDALDDNTAGLRKDVFYTADGALRVCDSEFGNTNTNLWWGYIKRNTFKYSGSGPDGSVTYNSWSLQDQEISPPAAGAHITSSLAPSAINQLDMYITQTNGGSGKGWYGGGANVLTARTFDVAYTFIYDGIQESPLFEFTGIDTFPINQPPAGVGNSIVTINVTALAGSWNPRITGARIYTNQTFPQGVEGWIFLTEIDMYYGQRSKFGEGSWQNWTYNSGTARPEITKVICVADSGASLDQKYFTIYTATGKTQIWIDTDGGTSPPSSAGYADVIEVTQIGTGDSANSVAIAIASAINEDGAPMTASVSGATIIITDNASAARTDAADVDTGFAVSTISTGIASGGAGYYRCSSPPMDVEPIGIPFQTITGFGEDVTSVGARYKTAVTANRRTYIGNIYQNDITGVLQQKGDAILKSPVNQFDVFPQDSILEASVNDGDEIIKLETYADRILQFKKTKLQLINISKEIEFLEDTFMHKGVSHTAATCKTDFGIAWVNRQGCYLYDGQKITNLLEKQGRQIIKESDWNSFTTDNSIIGYLPKKRQLIVLKDCRGNFELTGAINPGNSTTTVPGTSTLFKSEIIVGDSIVVSGETREVTAIASNTSLTIDTTFTSALATDTAPDCQPADATGDIYLFDMVTQSWTKGDSKFTDSQIQTNFVTDWNGDLVHIYHTDTGYVHKWDDDGDDSTTFVIQTKDIDFGNPAQKKKIYKVYVTYTGVSGLSVLVNYQINGDNGWTAFSSGGTLSAASAQNEATLTLSSPVECYSFQLKFSGTGKTTFEINDASIVFRLKGMR